VFSIRANNVLITREPSSNRSVSRADWTSFKSIATFRSHIAKSPAIGYDNLLACYRNPQINADLSVALEELSKPRQDFLLLSMKVADPLSKTGRSLDARATAGHEIQKEQACRLRSQTLDKATEQPEPPEERGSSSNTHGQPPQAATRKSPASTDQGFSKRSRCKKAGCSRPTHYRQRLHALHRTRYGARAGVTSKVTPPESFSAVVVGPVFKTRTPRKPFDRWQSRQSIHHHATASKLSWSYVVFRVALVEPKSEHTRASEALSSHAYFLVVRAALRAGCRWLPGLK